MKEALKDMAVAEFPVPSGVVFAKICAESGALAGESCPATTTEVFVEGTEPRQLCYLHTRTQEVDVCVESGQLATRYCPSEQVERRRYLVSSGLRILPDGTIATGESIPRVACKTHTWWTTDSHSARSQESSDPNEDPSSSYEDDPV